MLVQICNVHLSTENAYTSHFEIFWSVSNKNIIIKLTTWYFVTSLISMIPPREETEKQKAKGRIIYFIASVNYKHKPIITK